MDNARIAGALRERRRAQRKFGKSRKRPGPRIQSGGHKSAGGDKILHFGDTKKDCFFFDIYTYVLGRWEFWQLVFALIFRPYLSSTSVQESYVLRVLPWHFHVNLAWSSTTHQPCLRCPPHQLWPTEPRCDTLCSESFDLAGLPSARNPWTVERCGKHSSDQLWSSQCRFHGSCSGRNWHSETWPEATAQLRRVVWAPKNTFMILFHCLRHALLFQPGSHQSLLLTRSEKFLFYLDAILSRPTATTHIFVAGSLKLCEKCCVRVVFLEFTWIPLNEVGRGAEGLPYGVRMLYRAWLHQCHGRFKTGF